MNQSVTARVTITGDEAVQFAEQAQLGFTSQQTPGNRELLIAIDDARRCPVAAFTLDRTIHSIYSAE